MTELLGTRTHKSIKQRLAGLKKSAAALKNGNDRIEKSIRPENPAGIAKTIKKGDKQDKSKTIGVIWEQVRKAVRRLLRRADKDAGEDWSRAWGSLRPEKKRKTFVWAAPVTGVMAAAALAAMLLLQNGAALTAQPQSAIGVSAAQSVVAQDVVAQDVVAQDSAAMQAEALQEEPVAQTAPETDAGEDDVPVIFARTDTQVADSTYSATSVTMAEEDLTALLGLDEQAAQSQSVVLPKVVPEAASVLVADELVDSYVVYADAYYDDMGYSTNSYDYTEDDVYLLAQLIAIEAGGEPFEGMVAVGNVVMNRVLNTEEFGSTVSRVVKSSQFAYSRHSRRTPSEMVLAAARAVLEDEYWVVPQDVYFFRSGVKSGKDWKTREYYTTIGGHCFYTYHYDGRSQGLGIPPKLYERVYKYAQYGCEPAERVRRIQLMLSELGYPVRVDSRFGKDTQAALMDFQQQNSLSPDGIADPATIKALIKAYGFDRYHEQFLTE